MTVSPSRRALLSKLHVLKAQAGLDDDTYRAKLEKVTGCRSAADCSDTQLGKAIDVFHGRQNQHNPYTRKIRALWISAWNLGELADGSDRALDAFVTRQTGKLKLQFITAPEANKVTEALKAICARAGFVVPASDRLGRSPREALIKAQWAVLGGYQAVQVKTPEAAESYVCRRYRGCHGTLAACSVEQLDHAIRDLGRWIRTEQNKRRERQSAT